MDFPPCFIMEGNKEDRSENGFWIAHQQPATILMMLCLRFHLAHLTISLLHHTFLKIYTKCLVCEFGINLQ